MELIQGTRLGGYEIVGALGAGGMGRVFRARDMKLDRPVAIKVLRDNYAHDPEWLARFEREARLLATLDHPNIAAIHGLDETDDSRYLVMELVPGQTLAQRLARGPLPIDEALAVCKQIAAALEAAHDRGIIHRDLKPANVMLTPDDRVKILDFGLARSMEAPAPTDDSTAPYEGQTDAGVIVGTAAYMAPEQARGRHLDRRCDLWAFGCVLYETLTGRPAFSGATASDILAAVIERAPAWEALPARLPPRINHLLRRCLQKEPQKRLRDAGDARLEIEEAQAEPTRGPPTPRPARSLGRRLAWAATTMAVALAAFVLGSLRFPKATEPKVAESAPASVWSGQLLLGGATQAYMPRVSPDGRWLAFVVIHEQQTQVGVMKLDTGEWWVLTRNRERGQINGICWSRDSTRLYFDRVFDTPLGVYSVSPLDRTPGGAREVLVVAEAYFPQMAADGSLVVGTLDAASNHRVNRYSSNESLRVVGPPLEGWNATVRALHARNAIVFWGKILDDKAPSHRGLYILDLDGHGYRLLGDQTLALDNQPLAVSPRDDFACAAVPAQDSVHVVRIPLTGSGRPDPLLTLTMRVVGLDVDDAGQIYVDQVQRPLDVIRFPAVPEDRENVTPKVRPVERIAGPLRWRETDTIGYPLELPHGRVLLPSKAAGRDRLLVARPGEAPVPLLDDSRLETSPPATLVGQWRLAFLAGSDQKRRLRLATLEDEGVRLEPIDLDVAGAELTALTASPDGKTLYYVQARQVYEVAANGSETPRKLAPGDAIAVYPATGDLLIQRFEKVGFRLARLPRPSGPLQEVPLKLGKVRPAPLTIGGAAIDRDGRVLMASTTKDSSFLRPAILRPDGELQPIAAAYEGDIYPAGWSKDGKVLGMGYSYRCELWRFQRAAPGEE